MKAHREIGRKAALAATIIFVSLTPAKASETLTTLFAGPGEVGGNMFDLVALDPAGVRINGWDVNLRVGSFNGVKIWYRSSTFSGNHLSSAGWTLLGSATGVTSSGTNVPTNVPMPTLDLPFNQVTGIYIHVDQWALNPPPFNPGFHTTMIPPANSVYMGSGLRLEGGMARGDMSIGGDPFASPVFDDFMWNGRIHYSPIPEPATLAALGIGLVALAARRRKVV